MSGNLGLLMLLGFIVIVVILVGAFLIYCFSESDDDIPHDV